MSRVAIAPEEQKARLAWRQRGFRDGDLERPLAERGMDVPDEWWNAYLNGWHTARRERERKARET